LGDELRSAIRGALNQRINYVRDAIVLGTSYLCRPSMAALRRDRLASMPAVARCPWDASSAPNGLSRPNKRWTPFVAFNGRVREENNFSGSRVASRLATTRILDKRCAGCSVLQRQEQPVRVLHANETALGVGIWYDF